MEEQLKLIVPEFKPIEFEVSEIYLISRDGEVPFEVRHALQLGDAKPRNEFPAVPVQFTTFRKYALVCVHVLCAVCMCSSLCVYLYVRVCACAF